MALVVITIKDRKDANGKTNGEFDFSFQAEPAIDLTSEDVDPTIAQVLGAGLLRVAVAFAEELGDIEIAEANGRRL